MKLALAVLLCLATLAGCAMPFMADPAQAQREADQAKIARLDAQLAQAMAQMEALAKDPANAQVAASAKALAEGLAALKAERDATQKHKDELPKPHVDWDGLLGMAESGLSIGGLGGIAALIAAGRKAKKAYQEQIDENDSHLTAAVAGVEEFAADLPPEMKKKLYDTLKAAAREHAGDELAMAERVAVTKIRLRRRAA